MEKQDYEKFLQNCVGNSHTSHISLLPLLDASLPPKTLTFSPVAYSSLNPKVFGLLLTASHLSWLPPPSQLQTQLPMGNLLPPPTLGFQPLPLSHN